MGMTFSTLHLWGIGREALLPRLAPGDLLREQNAPWLGVVPDEEACGDLQRLEKLGKLLTKENGSAAALLFYYYDDDWFLCRLYQGGKKTAEGRGEGSWAKLGKKLNELFGDEAPAKALRYLSHCSDLQEQIEHQENTKEIKPRSGWDLFCTWWTIGSWILILLAVAWFVFKKFYLHR